MSTATSCFQKGVARRGVGRIIFPYSVSCHGLDVPPKNDLSGPILRHLFILFCSRDLLSEGRIPRERANRGDFSGTSDKTAVSAITKKRRTDSSFGESRTLECPLLAQSGHRRVPDQCPLSGVNRTSHGRASFQCSSLSRFAAAPRLTPDDEVDAGAGLNSCLWHASLSGHFSLAGAYPFQSSR